VDSTNGGHFFNTVYTVDMSEKHKMAMDTTQNGCFDEQAEAYLYAVEVLRDALSGLAAVGIAPNEQCDALGYTLINLLIDDYPEEHALLLFETLQSTLKACFEAGPVPSPKSTAAVSSQPLEVTSVFKRSQ